MKDIYAVITKRFVEQLKQGRVPWQRGWVGAQNIVSKKPYRGINPLILGSADFDSPYWMTFKQCSDLGGRIVKGEKSLPVVFYKWFDKKDEFGNVIYQKNGEPAKIPFIRWSNVFNLQQTTGIDLPLAMEIRTPEENLRKAQEIVENSAICPIRYTGFQPLYDPRRDEIRMPSAGLFDSQAEFYHTLYHELIHASGHESRLKREGVTNPVRFGSERYSEEELVAELGAAFLSNEAGILSQIVFENSAAYLQAWISKLQDDHKLILSAASKAQKGADLVLGITQKEAIIEFPEDIRCSQEQGMDTMSATETQGTPSEEVVPALAKKVSLRGGLGI